mgnify:CR=1 FL=1
MKYRIYLAQKHPLEVSTDMIADMQKDFLEAVEEIDDLRRQIEKERQSSIDTLTATLAAAKAELTAARADLAGLAIIMRDRLRGKYGISVEGPAPNIMALLGAINDFDAEFERQYAPRSEAKA